MIHHLPEENPTSTTGLIFKTLNLQWEKNTSNPYSLSIFFQNEVQTMLLGKKNNLSGTAVIYIQGNTYNVDKLPIP